MKKCDFCNREFDETLREIESNLCFVCNFWEEQYRLDQEYRKKPENYSQVIIVDGHHYVADTDPSHNGNSYIVKFKDGSVRKFNNLYCQGIIPENFREKFSDNADSIISDFS